MSSTTIRVSDPAELLALVPFQLGFHPRESAVVISLRGPSSRVGLVARVDLADLAHPLAGSSVAGGLADHLEADGAAKVVVVLYTSAALQGPEAHDDPTEVLARTARRRLEGAVRRRWGVVDTWVVGPGGFYAADCADRSCCPEGGRPLVALQSTQVGARMVLEGAAVVPDRSELARIHPAPPPARRAARRASTRWAARGREAALAGELRRWRRDGLGLWLRELDLRVVHVEATGSPAPHSPTPPTVLGRLAAALADAYVRDAALVTFLPDARRVADRVAGGDEGEAVGQALRAIIDPEEGQAPDREHTEAVRHLLEDVVAHGRPGASAPALTLLAVLAWWTGDGARADVLVRRALAEDPAYRLAALLDEALAAGMPPGWVRSGRR